MQFKIGYHPAVGCEVVLVLDDEGNYLAGITPSSTGLRVISELITKQPEIWTGPISGEVVSEASQAAGVDPMQVLALKRAGGKPWPASVDIDFDYSLLERMSS